MCFEAILRVKYATEHSIIRGFVTREIGKMTPRGWRRIHKILLPLRVWRRPCICGSRPKVHARYSRSKDRRSCLRGLAQERVSRFQLMPYLYTKQLPMKIIEQFSARPLNERVNVELDLELLTKLFEA